MGCSDVPLGPRASRPHLSCGRTRIFPAEENAGGTKVGLARLWHFKMPKSATADFGPAVPARLRIRLREGERPLRKRARLFDVGEVAGARERLEHAVRQRGTKRTAIVLADQPIGSAPQHQRWNPDAMQ